MSILTRFLNRLWPRRLARDLEDEVEFHIEMRAGRHSDAGMTADEASRKAQQQFGDVGSVIAQMRRERLASPMMLFATTALFLAVVVMWIAQHQIGTADLMTPAAPAAPIVRSPHLASGSPPPPRPGPTWDQYVKQTRAFEALQEGPGRYSPGRMFNEKARTR